MHRTDHHLILVVLLLVSDFFIESTSAISCYSCASTFPNNQICLPACSSSPEAVNTCILTRNISLDASPLSSLVAGPINQFPSLIGITDEEFLFGEEAIYHNPSIEVGWDAEYGPISYGCNKDNCNDPRIINRLPDALNVNIPNSTLSQLLDGDRVDSCYVCNTCVDENDSSGAMNSCEIQACLSRTCWFLASQNSPRNLTFCPNQWSFTSGCLSEADPAQVDMTLKYNIRTKATYLYEMRGVCHSEKCNNFTVFERLKKAINVHPDLNCLTNISNTTVGPTTFTSSSTTRNPTGSSSSTSMSSSTTTTDRSTTSRSSSSSSSGATTSRTAGPTGTTSNSMTTTSSALGLDKLQKNLYLHLLLLPFFFPMIQEIFF